MIDNTNLMFLVLAAVVLMFIFKEKEMFSQSGLAVSDRDCKRISLYHDPTGVDEAEKLFNNTQLCGGIRKSSINFSTGNFYTVNGVLV